MIIIPGLVAGFFNKKTKKGMYSGAIGISSIWMLYMSYLIAINNAYANLDQIGRFYYQIWSGVFSRLLSPIGYLISYLTGISSYIMVLYLTCLSILLLIVFLGLIMGISIKEKRKNIFYTTIGISSVWLISMLIFLFMNPNANLDQYNVISFENLGYGWFLFIIIILCGILFGMLGGAIGSYIAILIQLRYFNDSEDNLKIKQTSVQGNIKK